MKVHLAWKARCVRASKKNSSSTQFSPDEVASKCAKNQPSAKSGRTKSIQRPCSPDPKSTGVKSRLLFKSCDQSMSRVGPLCIRESGQYMLVLNQNEAGKYTEVETTFKDHLSSRNMSYFSRDYREKESAKNGQRILEKEKK
jgi:hypothetical protein